MKGTYVPSLPLQHSYTNYLQDDVLYEAVQKADADVAKAKAEADAKKWRLVADHMKSIKVSCSG